MGLLARADADRLEALWQSFSDKPTHEFLRQPEQGLVMTRGRAGGAGQPFNMGEMVVTRCSVQLAAGEIGHAYVAGRSHKKAELAAILDAMLQQNNRHEQIEAHFLAPLRTCEQQRRSEKRAKSEATKVDFFTLVRGED